MKYESINELHTFCFDDCVLNKFEVTDDSLFLEVEALQVRPKNSQNTNFTLSYAGPSVISLSEGSIISAAKEGFRYLNANGDVLSETPDVPIKESEMKEFLHSLNGVYLFSFEEDQTKKGIHYYTLEVEFPGEDDFDTAHNDCYEIQVAFKDAKVAWEFFQNRVDS